MDFDIVIIGAGVVGLAIASELSHTGKNILVLEANSNFGQETSSRNSEVIHAGMYYPSNSLKANLCVEGNRLMYEWCDRFNVPHQRIGKYIIAITKEDEAGLSALYRQGIANGVPGLELLTKKEFEKIEPYIQAESALFSSSTGIVDSHSLMQSLETNAINNGVTLAYNHQVINIEKGISEYCLSVKFEDETFSITSNKIINSAGLNSDKIAELAGLDLDKENYRLHFAKGHYFRLIPGKNFIAKHLIYPAPQKNWSGIGIHITLDLAGSIKFGPDIKYMSENSLDYSFQDGLLNSFYNSIKRYVPTILPTDIFPDLVGIRPKLQKSGDTFRDFIIQEESKKGLNGFWNLIGIESPGLTASLAIGKYIASKI